MRKACIGFLFLNLLILFNRPAFAMGQADSLTVSALLSNARRLYLTRPDSAIAMANRALKAVQTNGSRYHRGYGFFVLSKSNWAKANYRLSAQYGFEALEMIENSPYINLWGESLLALGRTFVDLRNYADARKYIVRALQLGHQHKDDSLIAAAYREYSMLLSETKPFDSAIYYADKALSIYNRSKDTLSISVLYSRKAKVHLAQNDFRRSLALSLQTIQLDSLVNNQRGLAISYYYAGLSFFRLGNHTDAIAHLKRSLSINEEFGNVAALVKVHSMLAEIYSNHGNTKAAVVHLQSAGQLKDTLYHLEKNRSIQEMQLLYNLESKDKTITNLAEENASNEQQVQNQRVIMALLAAGILLLATLILVLIRLRRLQGRANENLAKKNLDIEHQKEEIQAQAENLQQLNHLKSKLFSVISHDLRGPISNLHALLELFAHNKMTAEEFVMLSEKLRSNLNLTQRTLENLLNWSLSQMEGLKTERKIFQLNNTIEETCKLMAETASRKQVLLQHDVPMAFFVKADPNQIQLILRNLIHNAIKFSEEKSNVLITVRAEDGCCRVLVKDYGMGMSEEELAALLDTTKYFTKTGTQQEKGTGLGLLLCQEFILQNEGHFAITSTLGEGTEVSFTLVLDKIIPF